VAADVDWLSGLPWREALMGVGCLHHPRLLLFPWLSRDLWRLAARGRGGCLARDRRLPGHG